ncbi:MAG TPA: hypothetical protein VIG32_00890 [Candidatus Baltobacteraceae bacterium]|jgi:hypothetical protein
MHDNAALTPLVGSLIFKTARALGLDPERDRDALIAALERDALFSAGGATDLWERRYAGLQSALRARIVAEAVARLRRVDS